MSDLISREVVIDVLKQTGIIQDNDLGHLVIDEINRIPTAYDVEKVVAELEKAKEECYVLEITTGEPYKYYCQRQAFENAIDIVRKGGVE